MRLEGRIRKLEKRMISDPLILYFEDGSTREIRGRKYFLLDLLCAMKRNPTPLQAEQLELIRRAKYADEPGGGRLVELIQALTPDPSDPPDSPDLAESEGLDDRAFGHLEGQQETGEPAVAYTEAQRSVAKEPR